MAAAEPDLLHACIILSVAAVAAGPERRLKGSTPLVDAHRMHCVIHAVAQRGIQKTVLVMVECLKERSGHTKRAYRIPYPDQRDACRLQPIRRCQPLLEFRARRLIALAISGKNLRCGCVGTIFAWHAKTGNHAAHTARRVRTPAEAE